MSEEEWSLKNKIVKHDGCDDGDGYYDTWDTYDEKGTCYSKEDIETLREKLIEDIQMELYSRNCMELNSGIVEIINRRFGKE